jgi:hypothetical protein
MIEEGDMWACGEHYGDMILLGRIVLQKIDCR